MTIVVLLLGGGSAWATTGHSPAGPFGGLGTANGQFAPRPAGVGVMAPTGEVFTVDMGQPLLGPAVPRVQRFSAGGVFVSGFAINATPINAVGPLAVDPSGAGAVYVSASTDESLPTVVKYSAAGVFAYALDASGSGVSLKNPLFEPAGTALAVDPVDGKVYVTATNDLTGGPVVARFDATGAFLDFFDGSSSPDASPFCGPLMSIAVDSAHRVYVLDGCESKNRVDRFSATGTYEATVNIPPRYDGSLETPSAVAVDPVSDEVYVAHTGPVGLQITHFTAGGVTPVYTFDASAAAGGVGGMAVNGAGTVYAADATRPYVERFVRFDGPSVVTEPASSLGTRSVVLEGTINPEGVASTYHFEYGTDEAYGHRVPAQVDTDAGSGSVAVPASAALAGLEPNKTYVYRLVASNASGSIAGAPVPFSTLPAPPDVGDVFASAIQPRSARLNGTVNPNNNGFVAWHFDYGTTLAYGNSPFGGTFFGGGGSYRPIGTQVSDLQPGTLHHFRAAATDGSSTQYSPDETFYTSPGAGGTTNRVTAGRATLVGTINPHGVATTYHFEYGLTSGYGASTPETVGGSGDGERLVSQDVAGLSADTTYHVRVVAKNADGVVHFGGDGAFGTAPAPGAVVLGPSGVSTDSATLAGEVNTSGLAGSYHFDVWSLDSSFTRSTVERPVAGNASAERVSAELSGLPAGETFAVQLTVSSNDAIGVSDLLTFATADVPKVFPPPPGVDVYGCSSPRLNTFGGRPKPGEAITITGKDLGVGGSVTLADRAREPLGWSPSGFRIVVPQDAAGTLALTVNCGRRSNTIAIAVFQEPDNRFAVTGRSVSGTVATLRVRVPGPGKLESFGAGSQAGKVTIKKPGTAAIKVKLSSAEARALGRAASHTRKVKVRLRFTPAGGRAASKTVTITFKRRGAR